MEADDTCPLCCSTLDATDKACDFCACGYTMCLWCWHHIMEVAAKDNVPGKCPNCRSVYDEKKITMQSIDPGQLEDSKRKAKPEKKKAPLVKQLSKKDLANVRVLQKNLVYAVGLSMDICDEELLKDTKYFGQFGKVVKISVNRSGPHPGKAGSGSAYITYRRSCDAEKCIKAVDGITWSGRVVKVCLGTTKYCNAFLKGVPCNNPDCLYLHDVADLDVSFTKDEMVSTGTTKFATMAAAPKEGYKKGGGGEEQEPESSGDSGPSTSAPLAIPARVAQEPVRAAAGGVWGSPTPPAVLLTGGSGGVPARPTWPVVTAAAPAVQQPVPAPVVSDTDWPELSSAASGSLADEAPRPATAAAKLPAPVGTTMAEQIARAASNGLTGSGLGIAKAKKEESSKKLVPISSAGKVKAAPKVLPLARLAQTNATQSSGSLSEDGEAASTVGSSGAPSETQLTAAAGQRRAAMPAQVDEKALPVTTQQQQHLAEVQSQADTATQHATQERSVSNGEAPLPNGSYPLSATAVNGCGDKLSRPPPGFESLAKPLHDDPAMNSVLMGPPREAKVHKAPPPGFEAFTGTGGRSKALLLSGSSVDEPGRAPGGLGGSFGASLESGSSVSSDVWGAAAQLAAAEQAAPRGPVRSRSRFQFAQQEAPATSAPLPPQQVLPLPPQQQQVQVDPSAFFRSLLPGVNVQVMAGPGSQQQQQQVGHGINMHAAPQQQVTGDVGMALLRQLQGGGRKPALGQGAGGYEPTPQYLDPAIMAAQPRGYGREQMGYPCPPSTQHHAAAAQQHADPSFMHLLRVGGATAAAPGYGAVGAPGMAGSYGLNAYGNGALPYGGNGLQAQHTRLATTQHGGNVALPGGYGAEQQLAAQNMQHLQQQLETAQRGTRVWESRLLEAQERLHNVSL